LSDRKRSAVERVKLPTVPELTGPPLEFRANGANVTPLTVAALTPPSPTVNAPITLPLVLTSLLPEMVVAAPQLIEAASDGGAKARTADTVVVRIARRGFVVVFMWFGLVFLKRSVIFEFRKDFGGAKMEEG